MKKAMNMILLVSLTFSAQAEDKPKPRQIPPQLREMLREGPQAFLRRLDKNKDGFLSANEQPRYLSRGFKWADRNNDNKLGQYEINLIFNALRRRFGLETKNNKNKPNQKRFAQYIKQLDRNNDGKISKEEARGGLLKNFARIDGNKDGFLDRTELARVLAQMARQGQNQNRQTQDFDSLDSNADGRLTREELARTALAARFAVIDKDNSGKIDSKEFAEFVKTQQKD